MEFEGRIMVFAMFLREASFEMLDLKSNIKYLKTYLVIMFEEDDVEDVLIVITFIVYCMCL